MRLLRLLGDQVMGVDEQQCVDVEHYCEPSAICVGPISSVEYGISPKSCDDAVAFSVGP